jgi:hypothetical protein
MLPWGVLPIAIILPPAPSGNFIGFPNNDSLKPPYLTVPEIYAGFKLPLTTKVGKFLAPIEVLLTKILKKYLPMILK